MFATILRTNGENGTNIIDIDGIALGYMESGVSSCLKNEKESLRGKFTASYTWTTKVQSDYETGKRFHSYF